MLTGTYRNRSHIRNIYGKMELGQKCLLERTETDAKKPSRNRSQTGMYVCLRTYKIEAT